MRSESTTEPTIIIQPPSLTDSILMLCASGRFGVREAIAAATEQQQQHLNAPSDQNQEQQGG